MSFDEAALKKFLIKRTKEVWEASKQPYYLARVQPELKDDGNDYKAVTGEKTLSDFAGTVSGVTLVRHPHQRAKVGLVPTGESFQFREAAADKPAVFQPKASYSHPRSQRIVIDFLKLLSQLDDDDLEGFEIPAAVIAKLLRL